MVITYIRIIVDFCYIWIMDCIHKQPRLWLDFIISYAVQSDHGGIKEPQWDSRRNTGWWFQVVTPLKNISQLGLFFPLVI